MIKRYIIPILLLIVLIPLDIQIARQGYWGWLNLPFIFYGPGAWLVFNIVPVCSFFLVRHYPTIMAYPSAAIILFATFGIVWAAFTTHMKSGGWISGNNYDTTVPIILLGYLLGPTKWRKWLSAVAIIGLFFSGAEIGLLAAVALLFFFVVRREWTQIRIPAITLAGCLLIATPLGITHDIWVHNGVQVVLGDRIGEAVQWLNGKPYAEVDYAITGTRLLTDWHNIREVSFFGYGYRTGLNPSNQILVMTDHIGLVAAGAWLVVTLLWGIYFKQYAIMIVILVVSCFDIFFWRLGIYWWFAIMGLVPRDIPQQPNYRTVNNER